MLATPPKTSHPSFSFFRSLNIEFLCGWTLLISQKLYWDIFVCPMLCCTFWLLFNRSVLSCSPYKPSLPWVLCWKLIVCIEAGNGIPVIFAGFSVNASRPCLIIGRHGDELSGLAKVKFVRICCLSFVVYAAFWMSETCSLIVVNPCGVMTV